MWEAMTDPERMSTNWISMGLGLRHIAERYSASSQGRPPVQEEMKAAS